MDIAIVRKHALPIDDVPIEVVERKGIGHPDSLADGIAERISVDFSQYGLLHPKIGHILHHNVDKIEILGGQARVSFGRFELLRPVTVVLSGRMTVRFGDEAVPAEAIAAKAARAYLAEVLPLLDQDGGLAVDSKINVAGSPGRTHDWYRPRGVEDLTELRDLRANDTVCCVAYAPLSVVESVVLDVERHLNSPAFKASHPIYGSDIKVLAYRRERRVHFTLCVPLIAQHTGGLDEYVAAKRALHALVESFIGERLAARADYGFELSLNTKDDYARPSLYLTGTGSAIENGDEGQVGRGNRSNGVISNVREMCVEAPCGKNPVYHAGKVYNVVTRQIADTVHALTGAETYVNLVTQNGRPMDDPLAVVVKCVGPLAADARQRIQEAVAQKLSLAHMAQVTDDIVHQRVTFF